MHGSFLIEGVLLGQRLKTKENKQHVEERAFQQGRSEESYIGMRAGLSPSLWVDEVLDQQLKLHLRKEYRNEAILPLHFRIKDEEFSHLIKSVHVE